MAAGRNKFFRKVLSGSREMTSLQTNVEQAVGEVIKSPLINGRLLENVILGTASVRVEHKLGRKPQGYIVVRRTADAQVFDSQAVEGSPDLFLPLTASAPVTVSLWIF